MDDTLLTQACAAASVAAGEPLAGTAPVASAWLLWEARSPWAPKSPLARDVSEAEWAALGALKVAHGAKLLWVRGESRRVDGGAQALTLAQASPAAEGVTLSVRSGELDALRGADLWRAPGAQPLRAPLFVVCAHGKRDACCARLGLPTFRALADACPPGAVWQSTHLGGHRFAPTLLVLPWGYCYGRLTPGEARDLPAAFAAGQLAHLHRLRGRCDAAPHVQAAEVALRQHFQLTGLDAIASTSDALVGPDRWRVTLRLDPARAAGPLSVAARAWAVEVSARQDPTRCAPPSCGDAPKPITALVASTPAPLP